MHSHAFKMCIFDVDDTIRVDRQPVRPEVSSRMREISEHIKISFISGKDMAYVLGVADGMGVNVSYAVGEVGGVIFRPASHHQHVYKVRSDDRHALGNCERRLQEAFGSRLWFQPNLVNITVLPLGGLSTGEVLAFARRVIEQERNHLYASAHSGMVDIMPDNLDKGIFIDHLQGVGYETSALIAVGDGENDIPMLVKSGLAITFESSLDAVKQAADIIVRDIHEALDVVHAAAQGE